MSAVYHPSTGLLALDAPTLAAVIAHARGQRLDPAVRRSLDDAGMLVADRLDAPLHATIAPLLADGPRIRLLSRSRGRLTLTDAAFAPATPRTDTDGPAGAGGPTHAADTDGSTDGPAGRGRAAGATVVVRPPDSALLHVRHAPTGSVTRVLAASLGLGPHVLTEPPFGTPLDLRDWAIVRSGFDSATPSGWVRRRDQAELHEVRWAPAAGISAATALVIARLDGGLAEIRPRDSGDRGGAFTITSADTLLVWRRLCALTTGRRADGGRSNNVKPAHAGQPVTSS